MLGMDVVLVLDEPVAAGPECEMRARQWRDVVFERRRIGIERLIKIEHAEAECRRRCASAAATSPTTTPAAPTRRACERHVADEAAQCFGIALHREARGQEAQGLQIIGDEG